MKAVTKKLQSGGVQEGPGFTHQSWDRLQPHCHPELDNQKKMDGLLFLFAFCFLATWSFLWGGVSVYLLVWPQFKTVCFI